MVGPRPSLATSVRWWQGDGPAKLLYADSGVLARLLPGSSPGMEGPLVGSQSRVGRKVEKGSQLMGCRRNRLLQSCIFSLHFLFI